MAAQQSAPDEESESSSEPDSGNSFLRRFDARFEALKRRSAIQKAAWDARQQSHDDSSDEHISLISGFSTVTSEESERTSTEVSKSDSQSAWYKDLLRRQAICEAKEHAFHLMQQEREQQREQRRPIPPRPIPPRPQPDDLADDGDISIMSGFSTVTSMLSTAFSYVSSGASELTGKLGFRN